MRHVIPPSVSLAHNKGRREEREPGEGARAPGDTGLQTDPAKRAGAKTKLVSEQGPRTKTGRSLRAGRFVVVACPGLGHDDMMMFRRPPRPRRIPLCQGEWGHKV